MQTPSNSSQEKAHEHAHIACKIGAIKRKHAFVTTGLEVMRILIKYANTRYTVRLKVLPQCYSQLIAHKLADK